MNTSQSLPRRRVSSAILAVCFALTTLQVFTSSASASIKIVTDFARSESGLGSFEALFSLTSINAGESLLTIQIENISPPLNGGYITGLAFNNPGNAITSVSLDAAPSDFELMGASSFNNSISASPFGSLDIGSGLSERNFNGSGNPTKGIGVGEIGTFNFRLFGTNLAGLTEQSFIDSLSEGAGNPDKSVFFLVRFRGFEDGGSDKSVGKVHPDDDINANSVVPEPASVLAWLGLGFAGAFAMRLNRVRRRRS